MIESFVDLAYRGLTLQRRVKLTHVRPSNGYLEMPAPMPIGTTIAIGTDEGVTLEAVVVWIHEQVGGSDHTPGMGVAPKLEADSARSWWHARVALPELVPTPRPERGKPVTVRPRSHTVPTPPPVEATTPAPAPATVEPVAVAQVADVVVRVSDPHVPHEIIDDGRATSVMDAVDPALLEELQGPTEDGIVDDGKQTTMMDSVDPAALGLDAGSSGPLAATDEPDPDDKAPKAAGASVRKRRKRR